MAQGTFDVIHPGHIHYLKKSKQKGTHLTVVLARNTNADKNTLVFTEEERKTMVQALKPVDQAILGSKTDKTQSLNQVKPDVITLGKDQEITKHQVQKMVDQTKIQKDIEIKRISEKPGYSSTDIKNRVKNQ